MIKLECQDCGNVIDIELQNGVREIQKRCACGNIVNLKIKGCNLI